MIQISILSFFIVVQPGGSLFNIEHSNQGLITFPGGVPLVTKGFYLNILSFNITKVPFSSLKNICSKIHCTGGKQAGGIGVSGSTVENDKAVAQVLISSVGDRRRCCDHNEDEVGDG